MYKIYTRSQLMPGGYGNWLLIVCHALFDQRGSNKRKWIMRAQLIFFIMLISLLQVSAAGFGQQFTLKKKDISYTRLFFEIRRQTGYDVLLRSKDFNTEKKIDADFNNVDLKTVMTTVLYGTPLVFEIADKTVVISKRQVSIMDKIVDTFQVVDIAGKVLDSNGEPLVGATVRIKGTDRFTITDSNGGYMLRHVPDDAVIVISFVGHRSMEIGTKPVKVVVKLELINNEMQEIKVSAGYYSVTRREMTGSIARVAAKDIENQPVNNVLSAVQGRMAGVNIIQNSGVPGGGFDVQIRGRNSLRSYVTTGYDGNKPLYVVDGVPLPQVNDFNTGMSGNLHPYSDTNPLHSINPDDIESFEVLKDADATAIYGSKGANGVILITTKKGKKKKTGGYIKASYGLGDMTNLPKMISLEQYLDIRKLAFANDGVAIPANAYDINGTWDPNKSTDWQKYFIGNHAKYSDIQFGVSGGTGNTQFSISGGHNEETTVFPGNYRYRRNSIGASLQHGSADGRFKIGFSGYAALQDNVLPPTDFNLIYASLAPNAPDLYAADGSINWQNNTFTNPMGPATQTYNVETKSLNSNLTLGYEIGRGFSVNINAGYSNYNSYDQKIFPKTTYNPSSNIGSSNSSVRKGEKLNQNWIVEPQLNYSRKWDAHQFSALLGTSFQEQQSDNIVILGRNFPSDEMLGNISAAATITIPSAYESKYRYQAIYARLNYGYQQRYFVNLTGRRDASSRFGTNKRYANFGAVGAAWLFSEESMLKNSSWLSFGKLRASYGITGNDQIGDYQFYDTYQTTGGSYDGYTGLVPQRLFNKDFGWEVTRKFEVAVDLGILNQRLLLDLGYYHNISSSQLVGIPMPATVGFGSMLANLDASVRNRGLEFSLQSVNIRKGKFKWTTNLNFTLPENKLLKFPDLANSTYASKFEVGKSTSLGKLYQYTGIDPATGLYTFNDINHDGRINATDRFVTREIREYWYGGIQNSIQYKNWSLDILLQMVKQSQYNMYSVYGNIGYMENKPSVFLDYWTPENLDARFQKPSAGYNAAAATSGSLFTSSDATVSDVFTIRVKNISLSYQLPPIGQHKSVVRFFANGQNLFLFSNYKGSNPEFMVAGYSSPLRVMSLGMSLTF